MSSELETATFWEHVNALRSALIRVLFIILSGIVLSFCFYKQLFLWLLLPLQNHEPLVILGPMEGFSTMLKLSFWVGFVLTSPFWLYAVIKFITPALTAREKQAIFPFFFLSFLFATSGFAFCFYFTIPAANAFLESFNADIGENLWSLQHYLDYTVTLLLAHMVAFEIAASILFLLHYGFISARTLAEKRSYTIVAIFILSAVLTPPDVMTQLMLAIPLVILHEMIIAYGYFREKLSLKSLDLQSDV